MLVLQQSGSIRVAPPNLSAASAITSMFCNRVPLIMTIAHPSPSQAYATGMDPTPKMRSAAALISSRFFEVMTHFSRACWQTWHLTFALFSPLKIGEGRRLRARYAKSRSCVQSLGWPPEAVRQTSRCQWSIARPFRRHAGIGSGTLGVFSLQTSSFFACLKTAALQEILCVFLSLDI